MRKKFVIITMQRSGSNMLAHLLDEHPEIACFGELMRVTPAWMYTKGYRGALTVLEKVDTAYKDDRVRFAHPREFVETVYQFARRKSRVIGFKLHTEQHPEFMEQLIADPEYDIVLLYRENVLAKYSSELIAKQTGQGNARKGDAVKRARVEFRQWSFKKHLERVESDLDRVRGLIAGAGKQAFEIRYSELNDRQRLAELIRFLGADDTIVPEPATEKRNPPDILERFTNPEEARRALEEVGHPEWAVEDS